MIAVLWLEDSLWVQMAPVGTGNSQVTVYLEHFDPLLMNTFIPLDNSDSLLEPESAL
jgi:hypothetical protein